MRKLKARGLHEHVMEEIGKGIISGEFAPGKALPAEEVLCRTFGVSRTPLRESLRVLASKGLVEPKRKLGTMVRTIDDWNLLDAEILSWSLEVGDAERAIAELYELRHLLEPVAASLAAKRGERRDVQTLRHAYEAMCAAGDDGEKIADPDLQFHQYIFAASGNRLFSTLGHMIGAALAVNFELVRDVPRGHVRSMPAHRKVLEAIEAHDAHGARVAMQQLIEDSRRDARMVRAAVKRRGVATPPRKVARGR